MKRFLIILSVISCVAAAQASMLERPAGFRIGQRMTVRPYVAVYYTYDSNTYGFKNSGSASSWSVNPGATVEYKQDNWNLSAGAYYSYRAYTKHPDYKNQQNYGQNLAFNWASAPKGHRGWVLVLRESFAQITEDNDMSAGGRGIGRDRIQAQFAGTLERRFTEKWHADLNASYYYIDYDNDKNKYHPLYGWSRWTAGSQIGYAATKWTDFILAANYQGYEQDNNHQRGWGGSSSQTIDSSSKGWTVHGGISSYATERISYRATVGWSAFEYAGGARECDGFTYAISGNWLMTDRWNMMMLATSYFQPSETTYASLNRVDTLSWGIGHTMIRGKLNATFDIAYRHQEREYVSGLGGTSYDEDIFSTRFGLTYTVNRLLSLFTNVEYQFCDTTGRGESSYYDYDRWRLTLGMRLTY